MVERFSTTEGREFLCSWFDLTSQLLPKGKERCGHDTMDSFISSTFWFLDIVNDFEKRGLCVVPLLLERLGEVNFYVAGCRNSI